MYQWQQAVQEPKHFSHIMEGQKANVGWVCPALPALQFSLWVLMHDYEVARLPDASSHSWS